MDILALVLRRPKRDAAQRIANVHADTDDIVKEMLGIKLGIKIRYQNQDFRDKEYQ